MISLHLTPRITRDWSHVSESPVLSISMYPIQHNLYLLISWSELNHLIVMTMDDIYGNLLQLYLVSLCLIRHCYFFWLNDYMLLLALLGKRDTYKKLVAPTSLPLNLGIFMRSTRTFRDLMIERWVQHLTFMWVFTPSLTSYYFCNVHHLGCILSLLQLANLDLKEKKMLKHIGVSFLKCGSHLRFPLINVRVKFRVVILKKISFIQLYVRS